LEGRKLTRSGNAGESRNPGKRVIKAILCILSLVPMSLQIKCPYNDVPWLRQVLEGGNAKPVKVKDWLQKGKNQWNSLFYIEISID